MDFKRILKTPLFWVIVVVATTLMVFSFSDGGGYTRIDTSAAEKLISEDKAQSVKLTNNEVIDIDLKSGQTYSDGDSIKNATKVRAQYVDARKEMTNAFAPVGLDQVRFEDPRWSIPVNLGMNFRF